MTENGISESEQVIRDASQAAVGAAQERAAPAAANEVVLRNGVRVRIKPVSGLLIRRAAMKVEKPKVPMWHNEDRGRDEPNPNDPDYLDALETYNETQSLAALDAMFLMGVEIVEKPEGIPAIEDTSWTEEMEFLGITVAPSGLARKLDWLRYVIFAAVDDLLEVSGRLGRLAGITEGDVAQAVESFRRAALRGADNQPNAGSDADRDRVQPVPAGDRAGD